MKYTPTQFVVARAINGISINGDEYLLDDENEVIGFDSREDAIQYLKDNGCADEEIESFSIIEELREIRQ